MLKTSTIIAVTAILGLSACAGIDTDGERAIVGAGAGALTASALGEDTTTGALGGALVGTLADDVGLARRSR